MKNGHHNKAIRSGGEPEVPVALHEQDRGILPFIDNLQTREDSGEHEKLVPCLNIHTAGSHGVEKTHTQDGPNYTKDDSDYGSEELADPGGYLDALSQEDDAETPSEGSQLILPRILQPRRTSRVRLAQRGSQEMPFDDEIEEV